MAEVYDGGSRTDASRIGGVGLQIIRDWVLRFNARGPDGLVDGKSPGAPSKLNADHRRALAEVVEAGPVPAVDGVVRWRRKDLARWLLETFAISLDETTVGRELKALGFAKISARPRHYAQNELAVEAFKKNFPAELAKIRARLPKGVEIELWWQDEARIGQKNKLTRRWARRGTRPRAPRDQRTEWAYIFGAICPAKGKGAGLVMPWCDTDVMAAHLIEISAAVDPGAHAVLIVDQAGWHLTPKLAIPDNITVLALPPRSPELNPVENVWQFMRDSWLSNRIFKSYEDIVATVLPSLEQPHRPTMEDHVPGMRKWAESPQSQLMPLVLYHRAECLTHVGDSQAVRSLTQCGEPMRFAMAAPIDLRNDFDSVSLRRLAKRTRDATQSRRLLALAEVYDGGSRTDASRIGGVGLQIIRDWVLRFNARGPDGLVDGKSPGAPSKLNADHRRALAEVVEAGPVPAVDGVVRWRRKDLARWLLETFAISLDETTVGRELKALGFAKISARPRHYAQNELAVEAFKKNFPAELAKIRARLPKGVEIELWWQDEARIGQKNKLTRRWARRGTRPRAPRDQRTEWAYIFGAICPAKGKGAGLVMPWCDTDAMAAHLIEISAAVDPGAHAVLIVDQAGWHLTPKLAIPDNITVLALPPRSPELNPVENVWQFMRDNWLSNRIFKSYEDIVALCCQAWNNLIDQPWKIMSLGMRKWAHGF